MKCEYQALEALAVKAAKVVGERILESVSKMETVRVDFKSPTDLVTEIDIWAEKIIVEMIKEQFPSHQILGEESAADSLQSKDYANGFCWVLDPIDGTTNFVSGIPHSAVSVAVMENGESVVAVIFDPFRNELFTAIKGGGAFLNAEPIKVSAENKLGKSVVATGYPYGRVQDWPKLEPIYNLFFRESRDMRVFGAAVLDQCWVACGRLDAFFEMGLKPWDVAAGSLIVQEAGGVSGNPLESGDDFSSFANNFLFACPKLYLKINKSFKDLG